MGGFGPEVCQFRTQKRTKRDRGNRWGNGDLIGIGSLVIIDLAKKVAMTPTPRIVFRASQDLSESPAKPRSTGFSRFGAEFVRADSTEPVARCVLIAFPAGEALAERAFTALGGGGPGPVRPRRVVAHMLVVPALELGDPVPFVVPVKADDALVHRGRTSGVLMSRVQPARAAAAHAADTRQATVRTWFHSSHSRT